MSFAAALSTALNTKLAIDDACAQALGKLQGQPELALVFYSPHHAQEADSIAAESGRRLGACCLIGCIGEAIVANDQEIEQQPALCVWLARWSRTVVMKPFHMELEDTAEGHSLLGWPDDLGELDPARSAILLLGDPFSFPVDAFLHQINENHRGLRVLGGMASGIHGPGECRLLLGDRVINHGAVGVLLQGDLGIQSVVSQGCRPIGRHMVITLGKDNIIAGLGGKPPLSQLQELWGELSEDDRRLFQQGLHIGRVINEYQGEFHQGDFLVRNVLGLDHETGSLAINDRIRMGQTVQFHVRDAATADEDLHALLQRNVKSCASRVGGALLFTCNGRGTRLFSAPHHDARVVCAEAGNVPVAGFFAQGELGPVGGQNFIHGFTASVVLFEQ
jgi:small ligand-binding sensory domain FIST